MWQGFSVFTAAVLAVLISQNAHAASMGEAVRLAVENHPRGHAERANVRAVASELDESRRKYSPEVEIFGDIGRQRKSNPTATAVSGAGGTLTTREIGIRANYLIFDGYERANSVYRNAARLDGAAYRLLSAAETLSLNAVEAYIDVVRHRNLVEAARQNIVRHRNILGQIRERVRGGKAPASDGIQIEERVFAAEAVLTEVEGALRDANAKYRKIVGISPGRKMYVPGVKQLPRSKAQLIERAVGNNYSIKVASKAINEFAYARDGAMGGLMPRLTLEGKASAAEDRNGTVGDETDLYVGLRLAWKVYDGGQTKSRERTLAERVGQAEYQRDVTIRDVTELAERAWNAYHNGRKRNAVLTSQLQANRRIVSSYREEYELSKRSLLDVLDAERALFNNQFQQISVASSFHFAKFRILATMSRLASHFGISSTTVAPVPDVEERVISDPKGIFNITIEPLQ